MVEEGSSDYKKVRKRWFSGTKNGYSIAVKNILSTFLSVKR